MANEMVREFAPAKVNLFLDILSKRADGYHDLGTVFQTISVGDFLSAKILDEDEIRVNYREAPSYPLEKDLVFCAGKLLKETFGVRAGAEFFLEKSMPLGAGLGGGSADAAAALRLLNRLWKLGLSFSELEALGVKLGADVPFLIRGGSAFAEGIGQRLMPTSLEFPPWILIATPLVFVPTKEAYANIVPSGSARWENFKKSWTGRFDFPLFNKFEESVFEKYPAIASLKSELLRFGAQSALMSGSGASVFAVFDTRHAASLAEEKIRPMVRYSSIAQFLKPDFSATENL